MKRMGIPILKNLMRSSDLLVSLFILFFFFFNFWQLDVVYLFQLPHLWTATLLHHDVKM